MTSSMSNQDPNAVPSKGPADVVYPQPAPIAAPAVDATAAQQVTMPRVAANELPPPDMAAIPVTPPGHPAPVQPATQPAHPVTEAPIAPRSKTGTINPVNRS